MSSRAPYILLSLFVLVFSLPLEGSAACFEFTRTLKEGSRGADVIELQKVLNQDPATQVTKNGAGSPGNEISIFGKATTLALKRFQERYRGSILTPSGLKNPTGTTDSLTRKKLGELSCANISNAAKKPVTAYSLTLNTPDTYQVRIGDTITLTGSNLAGDTSVTIGRATAKVITASNERITFTIPTDAPLGVATAIAKNSKGSSNPVELFIGRTGKNIKGMEACLDITRTLKIGDSGSDVLLLQRFLNSDNRTKISEPESRSFSSAASNAVARFQVLYRDDILVPAKLTSPTGIVSLFTADKIREITCGTKKLTQDQKAEAAAEIKKVDKTATEKAIEETIALRKKADQALDSISAQNREWLDNVTQQYFSTSVTSANVTVSSSSEVYTLYGSNFTPTDNSIYVCDKLIARSVSANVDYKLVYTTTSKLRPSDSCTIAVSNANGESNPVSLKVDLKPVFNIPTPQANATAEDYQALLKSMGY